MTGNEGSVQACGDTRAHTHMWNKAKPPVAVGGCTLTGLLSMWMFICEQCHGVCVWLRCSQLWDQARTGSSMWVNCDLAISLPGGDKSLPCWCVSHSVITSSCHDCLRMRASGNLHCRSFTDTSGENIQHLFHAAQFHLLGIIHQISRDRNVQKKFKSVFFIVCYYNLKL